MHLRLTATGNDNGIEIFRLAVDGEGNWVYESRAIEKVTGELSAADRAQLEGLFKTVEWQKKILNATITPDDLIRFRLDVAADDLGPRTYLFSEAMRNEPVPFRDLVHFLRHNVATGGEPAGRIAVDGQETPLHPS